jgi:hypothetical protein
VLWLKHVILATWEAEIRRVVIPGNAPRKVHKTPTQLKNLCMTSHLLSQLRWEVHSGPEYGGWRKQDPILKTARAKRVEHMGQVVQHLPCKYKALSSDFSTAKRKHSAQFTQTEIQEIRTRMDTYGVGCDGFAGLTRA